MGITAWCLMGFVYLAFFDSPKEGRTKREHVIRTAVFVGAVWLVLMLGFWPGGARCARVIGI